MEARMSELTITEIVDWFRKKYPDAVMVSLNISNHTVDLIVKDIIDNDGTFTVRKLNGEWLEVVKQ
jgi:hypothetical protein